MFSNMEGYKESVVKRLHRDEKIDPGAFSLMEPGWWVLHVTAIAGVYMLGSKLRHRHW